MGVFSIGGVGIDLGSANVTICLENEGVVLREPGYVLTLREDMDEILAVGRDARQMLGRTPKDVVLQTPVANGAVGNIEAATAMLRALSEKALGKRRALERNPLVVSCPQGATRVELDALENTVRNAGARKAWLLRTPIAAALGAGVAVDDFHGCLMLVIGSAVTEVSILSMSGIAAARTVHTGSMALDEAIMRYVRREKGLIIGQRTAEDLKIDLGTARDAALIDDTAVTLRGRDARTGRPSTVDITAREIRRAIDVPLESLLETIREAFENTPAEMAEDILRRGAYLSGGGALLDGLADRLSEMLGFPVVVDENPQDDTAIGCCVAAAEDRVAQKLIQSGCLIEL